MLVLYYPEQNSMYIEIQNIKYSKPIAKKELYDSGDCENLFEMYRRFIDRHKYYLKNSTPKELEDNKNILLGIKDAEIQSIQQTHKSLNSSLCNR